jgi:hypothetical protein
MHTSRDHHLSVVGAVGQSGDDFVRSQEDLFDHLVPHVGSADALWRLDTLPLPDEPFDWSAVADGDRSFVEDVLAQTDRCCDLVLDVEFRTIIRRILARVAAHDPRPFRRSPHAARCAASLVWLAGAINGEFVRGGRLPASHVWSWFRVGNCADRGRTLLTASGLLDPADLGRWSDPTPVGDPGLLHSDFRAWLIIRRDAMAQVARQRRTWSVVDDDGPSARVEVRANPAKVVSAVKGLLTDTGRGTVIVGFGERVEDADYVCLTIPEAHELVRRVQDALDAPLPRNR